MLDFLYFLMVQMCRYIISQLTRNQSMFFGDGLGCLLIYYHAMRCPFWSLYLKVCVLLDRVKMLPQDDDKSTKDFSNTIWRVNEYHMCNSKFSIDSIARPHIGVRMQA